LDAKPYLARLDEAVARTGSVPTGERVGRAAPTEVATANS